MRVVSWNMDAWKGRLRDADHATKAWAQLLALEPDVALLQEAPRPTPGTIPSGFALFPSADAAERWTFGTSPKWTTALLVRTDDAKEIESVPIGARDRAQKLVRSHVGAWVAARAAIGTEQLVVVSLYGLLEGPLMNRETYATTSVHRSLSDLTPLLDGERRRGRVILAGDLNCSTQLSPPWREAHRAVFHRIGAFRLANLFEVERLGIAAAAECPCADRPCHHVQTHRHPGSGTPWCNDYVFVGRALAAQAASIRVDESSYALSDHGAVVAEVG